MSGARRCEGCGKFSSGPFEDWGGDNGMGGYETSWWGPCCTERPEGP